MIDIDLALKKERILRVLRYRKLTNRGKINPTK